METRSKQINFIKAAVAVITAVVAVFVLSKILILKSEDGIDQMHALYKQPENSVDVLFLGNSHVFCDIATGVLWDNYGMAAFDLGGAEAPSWVSYYHLREALKTQRPKVVCYEITVAALYPTLFQKDEWAVDNNYGMKWNSNRIEQLGQNSEGDDFYKRLIPLNIMHGRYKDLNKNDFTNDRNSSIYKGFDPRENVMEIERPKAEKTEEITPCSQKAEEYTRKIIELTKEEDIPIIFFVSPCGMSDEEQSVCNYIRTIAESEGVKYIDFNDAADEMGIDWSKDFADSNHLNYDGNYKFTDYVGSLLKQDYDIPDRRGDDKYVSWDWDAALQRNERNNLRIKASGDPTEVLNMVQSGYIVFSVMDGKAYIHDNGVTVASSDDENFRLTYESGDDSLLFYSTLDDENCYCTLYVNETEYTQVYSDIMFIYDSVRHEYVGWMYL